VPSPGREPPVVFHYDQFAWQMQNPDTFAALILDYDVRALFYEGLAVQLQQLCPTDADLPTIMYLGVCLRGPLQLAYADTSQLARHAVAIERRIEASWLDIADSEASPVQLPVWIDALFSTLPRDPAEVAERVAEWRERASAFRRRRQELEAQLADGDGRTARRRRSDRISRRSETPP